MSFFEVSFFLLFFFLFVATPSVSDPRSSTAAMICSNRTASTSDRQTFVSNFVSALDAVTLQIYSKRFAKVIEGSQNTTVYAFGQCMADLSQTDCNLCFAQSKTQIFRCFPFQKATRGGRIFLDGCYLRYDDYEFFEEAVSADDRTVCGETEVGRNQSDFRANVIKLLRNLTVQASNNSGFHVGYIDGANPNSTAYGLAQCWESVNQSSCRTCLDKAVSNITSCLPMEEGRVLNTGCYLRYSTQKFYNNSGSDGPGGGGGRHHLVVILAVCLSVIASLMVAASALFFGRKEFSRRRKERKHLGAIATIVNKSALNFKYETLEKATNYFHSSNKLGQGGSGSVYKGILPDGREVAIKRLFFNTRQWVDEFFNEVNLVSRIEHKNLVKLLGCSIAGPESILVYEYVPKGSLHQHLFDRTNAPSLSWEVRYNLILGTAEGLAYLHEESGHRIIHRDIKLGNVLLDENFTAKIADFGLARFFPEDKSHISTGIAGTLGYMAPEYLVRGKLTEKVDVYSFGVLLMEMICRRRNNPFPRESSPLLQMVWNHHVSNRLPEAVDPTLEGNFPQEEATRLLQIGLLCTQASAELRPSMSMVTKMLKDNLTIPSATQPPFLNANSGISHLEGKKSHSQPRSSTQSSGNSMSTSLLDPR
ncbi:cysteine-rich receptor-like protein kinase 3 [Aristolochia californica]|uniref:cysteine-rich receptor-like protein kinase 3 n=1 Tax=Aristolochia californica TaxID=171875 RepID=UPI0035E0F69A